MPSATDRLRRAVSAVRRDGLGGLADRVRLRAAFRRPGPWRLRLRGGRFRFEHRGELYAYVETFVGHVYDAVPGFTPRDAWTVVDVGANVGCFSAYALEHMRRGTVLALEPNPTAFARLQAWAAERRGARPGVRFEARRAAAGARPGEAAFVVPAGASVRGSLAHVGPFRAGTDPPRPAEARDEGPRGGEGGPGQDEERFSVEVLTLDAWLAEEGVGAVDLLKVDVEGAEGEVLAGAAGTLARTARVVLEWHGPDRLAEARRVLEAAGLRLAFERPDPADPRVGVAHFRREAPGGEPRPTVAT